MNGEPQPLQQIDRTFVRLGTRRLSYFSGCDYFRLASHPQVIRAAQSGLKRFGLNVAASRLTTGNHILYETLERELKRFFVADDALLVATGYETNLIVAQALAGNFSHALMDEKAHPALADAAKLLNCPVVRFKHRDANHLAEHVQRLRRGKFVLLTDGMFSQDGSVAPLKSYLKILPRDAVLIVDDAHGAGTLGKHGRGSLEFEGVGRKRIVQTITLSKAFGVFGGAILGTSALRRKIMCDSPMFIGSTPTPLPLANAALTSITILKREGLRRKLTRNVALVRNALTHADIEVAATPGPIISVIPKTAAGANRLSQALLKADIYPPFVKYPGGPQRGYFRFAISSEHTRSQLDNLVRVLAHG